MPAPGAGTESYFLIGLGEGCGDEVGSCPGVAGVPDVPPGASLLAVGTGALFALEGGSLLSGAALAGCVGSTFGAVDSGVAGGSVEWVVTKTNVRRAGPGPPANDVATRRRAATAAAVMVAV